MLHSSRSGFISASNADIPVASPLGLVSGLNVLQYAGVVVAGVAALKRLRVRLRSSLLHVPVNAGSVALESASIQLGQASSSPAPSVITTSPTNPTGFAYRPALVSGLTALAWYQSFASEWLEVTQEEWMTLHALNTGPNWVVQAVVVLNNSATSDASCWTEASFWEFEERGYTGQYPSLT